MNSELSTVRSEQANLLPAAVAAIVPLHAHEEFHRLKDEEKARVGLLLQLFQEIATAPEGVVACTHRLALQNPGKGYSAANLRALYYAFKKTSDWRVLVHKYKGPSKLPEEFAQEVKRRIEKNPRSARQAIQELKDEWTQGAAIPGYGTWREYFSVMFPEREVPERYPLGFYPAGWSERNLYAHQSSKAERLLAQRGYAAARRYMPHVMRDLSQLRPLELIVIDDFETDQLVQAFCPVSQRWRITRAAGLLAIDASTRRKLALGLKPRFENEEGRKMSITRADVQGLLYSVFSTHGLPAGYGCTILCENAAAAITGDFELALQTLLGVQVARTGLIHEKTLKNGFVQSGGKPWEKPWIESNFNLMHNVAGSLPGQKGASYQLKPADLEAKVLYAEKLLSIEGLPAEVAAQLRLPFLKTDDFLAAYERIFARMEARTQHELQGFTEIFDYALADGSGLIGEGALGTLSQEEILALTPVSRRESPVERWDRLIQDVRRVKVADYALACLLLTPKKVALLRHRLTFALQGEAYTFADADSPVMRLPEGTEVLGYFDAGRPGVLHVTDLKGRYLGTVRSRNRVDIRDQAALGAEAGEVSRLIHALVKGPVAARHAVENEQLGADAAHNTALLVERGLMTLPDVPSPASGSNVPNQETPRVSTPAAAVRPASLSTRLATAPVPVLDGRAAGELAQAVAREVGEGNACKTRAEALQQADGLDSDQLL